MDKYIKPEKEYRCSGCGILKKSQYYDGDHEEYCGWCIKNSDSCKHIRDNI